MKKVICTLLLTAAFPALAMADNATLRNDMTGGAAVHSNRSEPQTNLSQEQIMDIQRDLRDDGLYQGPIDGIWGPNSSTALRQYQMNNDLEATGALDTNTLSKFDIDTNSSVRGSRSMNSTGTYGSRAPMDDTQTDRDVNIDSDPMRNRRDNTGSSTTR